MLILLDLCALVVGQAYLLIMLDLCALVVGQAYLLILLDLCALVVDQAYLLPAAGWVNSLFYSVHVHGY